MGDRYWQVRQALARKHGSREEPGGPDMCLPMTVKEGTPLDAKSGFAEYRKCINSKPHLLRFRRLLRGAPTTLTLTLTLALALTLTLTLTLTLALTLTLTLAGTTHATKP